MSVIVIGHRLQADERYGMPPSSMGFCSSAFG
jgi:hypothetical protein